MYVLVRYDANREMHSTIRISISHANLRQVEPMNSEQPKVTTKTYRLLGCNVVIRVVSHMVTKTWS